MLNSNTILSNGAQRHLKNTPLLQKHLPPLQYHTDQFKANANYFPRKKIQNKYSTNINIQIITHCQKNQY